MTQFFVPMVVEQSGRGDRAFDIYSRLLRDRIIFLGTEIDDQVANVVISQLLLLVETVGDVDRGAKLRCKRRQRLKRASVVTCFPVTRRRVEAGRAAERRPRSPPRVRRSRGPGAVRRSAQTCSNLSRSGRTTQPY